jgi:hypothetical protein
MITALIIIVVVAVAVFVVSKILINKLMIPSAKPLTEEEVEICMQIVKQGKGYLYVCKWAIKHKKCPCLPCKKLEEAKATKH